MASEAVLNNLSSRPSVVIASSCDLQPSMIVKELLGILPIAAHRQEGWLAYLWKINNIYYEADVNLIVLKRKCLLPVVLRGTVRVVILMFDSYDEDFAIESWHSFLLPYRAFVRMLVCTKIDEDDLRCLPRLQVQHWCILHGFDLVELQSSADEWEEEQGFGDCTGMLRIKEALLGHMWPNLLCNVRVGRAPPN